MNQYPKRLIEVDLPIKLISEYARNEKNLRKGHVWHLHIWWARRPWGTCRAIELASILPDPTDPLCPDRFLEKSMKILSPLEKFAGSLEDREKLKKLLLNFIGEYAKWELGSDELYLSKAKSLIKASYPNVNPIVFDSFSGNGAIPGEALRLGCESIALELNPVANLVLKVLLESTPRYTVELLKIFRDGVKFIEDETDKRLSIYYPKKDGKIPIAFLWARTVICEGPGCGAIVPLISQNVITKGKRNVWIEINGNKSDKTISIQICKGRSIPKNLIKTGGGGSAVCPVCEFTTPKTSVKKQGKDGRIGNRLYGVVLPLEEKKGKDYFEATKEDHEAFAKASKKWSEIIQKNEKIELHEKFPFHDSRAFTAGLYGISEWGDLFSQRQKLSLYTITNILEDYGVNLHEKGIDSQLISDSITALALGISNSVHYWTNMSTWLAEHMMSSFITGNAIAMRWDWAEGNPLAKSYVGGLEYGLSQAEEGISSAINLGNQSATVIQGNAIKVPLPDNSVDIFFTDPPYYDVVPYADLSDLCYVWLKRFVGQYHQDLFTGELTPKSEQIVVNPYAHIDGRNDQSPLCYQKLLTLAFKEGRRILKSDGIGIIVFAHKGTDAWEKLLSAVIDAGFVVTASWPIDTERSSRMRANKSAALASSVHIIIRPRENFTEFHVGEWREVLQELPKRIHEWMPRLAEEDIVGADSIFACLGPALEIYSRYSSVEKANGEQVTLREYLEHVWAAVAKEALNMIFKGGDATGFEEDARLTAMWLWTLSTDASGNDKTVTSSDESDDSKSTVSGGFTLEYDAARKIAQGLGAHLENLTKLVETKGDKARLLPVEERTTYLFGKEEGKTPKGPKKKKGKQLTLSNLLDEVVEEDEDWGDMKAPPAGTTVLDRIHQAMILFAAGRGEALKRFLVEDGVGRDDRFWRLAQALSALYPSSSNEKRWVDGVLARKKGLGF